MCHHGPKSPQTMHSCFGWHGSLASHCGGACGGASGYIAQQKMPHERKQRREEEQEKMRVKHRMKKIEVPLQNLMGRYRKKGKKRVGAKRVRERKGGWKKREGRDLDCFE